VKDVNEYVQVGQEVEVKILEPARRGAPRRNEASNFKQEEAPGFTVLKDKLEDWIKNTNFKK